MIFHAVTGLSRSGSSPCYAALEHVTMSEKFGVIEAKEFCEHHEDVRVRLVWKWLCECRSKNARWAEALLKEQRMVNEILTREYESAPAIPIPDGEVESLVRIAVGENCRGCGRPLRQENACPSWKCSVCGYPLSAGTCDNGCGEFRKDELTELKQQVRAFLNWFNADGSPCDGFRFREECDKLRSMVDG